MWWLLNCELMWLLWHDVCYFFFLRSMVHWCFPWSTWETTSVEGRATGRERWTSFTPPSRGTGRQLWLFKWALVRIDKKSLVGRKMCLKSGLLSAVLTHLSEMPLRDGSVLESYWTVSRVSQTLDILPLSHIFPCLRVCTVIRLFSSSKFLPKNFLQKTFFVHIELTCIIVCIIYVV